MRRYLLTIILLLALLAVSGYAVWTLTAGPSLTRGGYVPTLSTDPATAQAQGLIFVVALLVIVSGTIGTGVILALVLSLHHDAGHCFLGSRRHPNRAQRHH